MDPLVWGWRKLEMLFLEKTLNQHILLSGLLCHPLHHLGYLILISLSTPTCGCGSFPESWGQTTTVLWILLKAMFYLYLPLCIFTYLHTPLTRRYAMPLTQLGMCRLILLHGRTDGSRSDVFRVFLWIHICDSLNCLKYWRLRPFWNHVTGKSKTIKWKYLSNPGHGTSI